MYYISTVNPTFVNCLNDPITYICLCECDMSTSRMILSVNILTAVVNHSSGYANTLLCPNFCAPHFLILSMD
jgi:hypothetical protein